MFKFEGKLSILFTRWRHFMLRTWLK